MLAPEHRHERWASMNPAPAGKARPATSSQARVDVVRIGAGRARTEDVDAVAVEEPLEIRLGYWQDTKLEHRALSITMRTPGNDEDLAAGFLYTEGVVHARTDVRDIRHCGPPTAPSNTIRVELARGVTTDLGRLQRNFYTTSSCGVCGKSSIEALATGARRIEPTGTWTLAPAVIDALPATLRAGQATFESTGGLHAAALFTLQGELIALSEDVGRHNAVDKLIGSRFLTGNLPADETILFLSGRASFELLQKAVMGGVPVVCAVGAPSSLAIEAAREFGVTLLGFVRDKRFNVYTGAERLAPH
jgi:FdhD protein